MHLTPLEAFLQRNVRHIIRFQPASYQIYLVAGGSEAFAVIVPLPGEAPCLPTDAGTHIGLMNWHIPKLLTIGLVIIVQRLSIVYRWRIGIVAGGMKFPVGGKMPVSL